MRQGGEIAKLQALRDDFSYYAPRCLKIQTKDPENPIINLEFNRAQQYLHVVVLAMLALVGMVRIIVVKGRQQGISTYIEGLFFWLATINPFKLVSIISHEAASTREIFDKVSTFNDHCPSNIRPHLITDNNKIMKWANKSRYTVFTAGSENTGRGGTEHYQHQSERAYFDKPSEIDAGLGQRVGPYPGTMVFKESTGNGYNHFEKETRLGSVVSGVRITKEGKFEVTFSSKGKSNYWVVFIPWYWQDEYRAPVPEDFEPTPHELELLDTYGGNGLTEYEQLQWRRLKIAELDALPRGNGEKWFKQEYPNCLDEAFQASGDPYFNAEWVERARKCDFQDTTAPDVLGVDPARSGDKTVIVHRKGRTVKRIWKYTDMDEDRLADILADIIEELAIDKCFIDYAFGATTVDLLHKRGFKDIVEGVWFGEKASKKIYGNKRAEMIVNTRDWLKDGIVNLPDDAEMAADILAIIEPDDRGGRYYFEEKKQIRKRLGRSPDIFDALILTHAHKVRTSEDSKQFGKFSKNTAKGSGLTTLSRIRENKAEDAPKFTRVSSHSRYRRQ